MISSISISQQSAARQLIEEQLLNSNSALNYSLAMFKVASNPVLFLDRSNL